MTFTHIKKLLILIKTHIVKVSFYKCQKSGKKKKPAVLGILDFSITFRRNFQNLITDSETVPD